jgi:16S rRNA G1207 methylase RsmC
MNINKLVKEIKASNQDFEWYPTTDEIIDLIKADLKDSYDREGIFKSVLDVGAGNGQTLNKLTDGNKYAIEKSEILVSNMPANIFMVGTDFYENSLIDKKVDIVFSNPPYSQYKEWAVKIINEANSNHV